MPWKVSGPRDERLQFVSACVAAEESMAAVCRAYGISRKTGYKWWARYQAEGAAGLVERSRAPHTQPQAVSGAVEAQILEARATHPTWGPRKLKAWWEAKHPARPWPAGSTVGAVLQRAGLTVPRPRSRRLPPRTHPLAHPTAANAVWCADFKGWWCTGDGARCTPLTITDAATRYLLRCQALRRTDTPRVQPLFEATFREYGLPAVLRTDNGPPFASTGLGGLTPLSVWWIKLGIVPERIDPGQPGQNGRHERMHRTLQAEAATPAASVRAQQRELDRFRAEYNAERPHEALGQVPPATLYVPAPRPYPARLAELVYPDAYEVRQVRHNGEIRWRNALVYVSQALGGEPVGLAPVADGQWELVFGPVCLGVLDERTRQVRPAARGARPTHAAPETRGTT